MFYIVSWSQGLVMAKDPCETTITKRLAWLVEQLEVSSHEYSFIVSSFLFYFFLKIISKIFLSFFLSLFLPSSLFTFIFIFFTTSIIFFSILFSKSLLILFPHRCFHRLLCLPHSGFHFHFFSFLFLILLTKKNC